MSVYNGEVAGSMRQAEELESPREPSEESLSDAALYFAESLGWSVLPLKPHDKEPLTAHGVKDASEDPDQVKKWQNRLQDVKTHPLIENETQEVRDRNVAELEMLVAIEEARVEHWMHNVTIRRLRGLALNKELFDTAAAAGVVEHDE